MSDQPYEGPYTVGKYDDRCNGYSIMSAGGAQIGVAFYSGGTGQALTHARFLAAAWRLQSALSAAVDAWDAEFHIQKREPQWLVAARSALLIASGEKQT